MRLSQLATRQRATIKQVHHLNPVALHSDAAGDKNKNATSNNDTTDSIPGSDPISTRLNSLGFVAGEQVEVITRGLFGGEPLLVKVGVSRFALRANEAARIEIAI